MAASFVLDGKVILDGANATATAKTLSDRLIRLGENSRTLSSTLKETAGAYELTTRAMKNELAAVSALNAANEKANAVRRQSLSDMRLTNAKTAGVKSATEDKSLTAAGQQNLLQAKALSEATKQQIALDDAEGRAAVRAAQIASLANRDRVAQARLDFAQEQAASREASLAQRNAERAAANAQRDAARQQAAAQREAAAGVRNMESGFEKLGTTATHVGVITGAIFVGLAANVVVMEREFASVLRTSDILDIRGKNAADTIKKQQDAAVALRLQFDTLAQTLPLTYNELTKIGAAANQLGVSHDNIASFTEVVAKFSATTGVSVDATSTAFGRLDALLPDVHHNYLALADAINKVGVTSVATDQQIINIASGVAGIATSAGLGYKAVIGFSGALASVGVQPYLARGLTTRLFTNINNAVSQGGDQLIKFASVSGMTAAQFKADWGGTQSQKEGALVAFFNGIRESGSNAVAVLKDLGVKSILDQPQLIKLADAADHTGKAGKLLAESFREANNAAGTNARQFAVIADTLQSRLTVGLNRTQILLRDIGESNVGALGDVINNVSDSVLRLSQGLNKPAMLLGLIKLPFTNGQLLGFASLALGAVAGFTLLVGVLAKVFTAFTNVGKGIGAVQALFSRGATAETEYAAAAVKVVAANDAIAASARGLSAAQAAARVGAVGTAEARATGLAATTVLPNMRGNVFAVNGAGEAEVVPTMSVLQRATNTAKTAVLESNNSIVKSFVTAGVKSKAALTTVAAGARNLGGAITSTILGPAGLIGTVVVGGLLAADDAMKQIGSTAGDTSVSILKAADSAQILSDTMVSAQSDPIAALFDKSTKSFMTGGNSQFKASADILGQGGLGNDFGSKVGNMFSANTSGSNALDFNDTTAGLDKIDAGFKNLADSGNLNGAVAGIQKFLAPLNDAERTNVLAHMGSATEILTTALNGQGISADAAGKHLLSLSKSNSILVDHMNQTQKAAYAQADAFAKTGTDGQDYITVTKKAALAALDLNNAWTSSADKNGNNTLSSFYKNADSQLKVFEDQTANIAKITGDIGPGYTKQLAGMPSQLLAAIVAAGPKAEAKLKEYMDRATNFDTFRQNFATIMGDPGMAKAYSGLGKNMQDGIKKSLEEGHSIEDAFREQGPKAVAAFNKNVKGAHLTITTNINDLDNLSFKDAKSMQIKILGDAGPAIRTGENATEILSKMRAYIKVNADTVLAQKKGEDTATYLTRLKSTMKLYGDSLPAIATGESTAFQIGAMVAQIKIDANPTSAKRTAAQTQDEVNKLYAMLTIQGDGASAVRTGKGTSDDIHKMVTSLVIDADKRLALSKGKDTAAAISNYKTILSILGDPAPAQQKGETAKQYIDRLRGMLAIDGDPAAAKRAADAAKRYGDGLVAYIKLQAKNYDFDQAIAKATRTRTMSIVTKYVQSGGGPQPGHGGVQFNANGGPIVGAGTGTSDSILSRLSNGEYVVRASQAQKHRSLLDAINYGLPGYASGGLVTGGSAGYNNTLGASVAYSMRRAQATQGATQVTELAPYDRYLLQTIADNIGVTIAPEYIAGATTNVNRAQSRRGNG